MLASTLAYAQSGFAASPGLGNLRLDLDTEGGHASHFELRETCGLNALRAVLTLPRLGANERWLPVASIALGNPDQTVYLQIGGVRAAPLPVSIRTLGKDIDMTIAFKAKVSSGNKTSIAIDWTPQGEVRMTVNDETTTVKVAGGVRTLSFSNSTGEAQLDPLSIGRTSAPVSDCPSA
jgi:hypothetical protein